MSTTAVGASGPTAAATARQASGGGCCSSSGGTLELVGAFTAVCIALYGVILYLNYLYVRWSGRDGVHRAGSGGGGAAGPPARKRDTGGGIDKAALAAFPVFRFKSAPHGGVGGGGEACSSVECPVCLGAMKDGDAVRALPGCEHAFHVACVDVWLCAHATCPVCRARPAFPPAKAAADTAEPAAGREPDLENQV